MLPHQNEFEEHLIILVLLDLCLLYYKDQNILILIGAKNTQTYIMKSKENISPEELRRRQLLARRNYLTERLRRIHELLASNRLLLEQIMFLRQRLAERPENSGGKTGDDGKQKEE